MFLYYLLLCAVGFNLVFWGKNVTIGAATLFASLFFIIAIHFFGVLDYMHNRVKMALKLKKENGIDQISGQNLDNQE